ncbi:hypothetical protein DIPPA_02075 [Diplonema papillatum]|nr:hypothetical protein DIPPA_02075 [Diplonema papillatum]
MAPVPSRGERLRRINELCSKLRRPLPEGLTKEEKKHVCALQDGQRRELYFLCSQEEEAEDAVRERIDRMIDEKQQQMARKQASTYRQSEKRCKKARKRADERRMRRVFEVSNRLTTWEANLGRASLRRRAAQEDKAEREALRKQRLHPQGQTCLDDDRFARRRTVREQTLERKALLDDERDHALQESIQSRQSCQEYRRSLLLQSLTERPRTQASHGEYGTYSGTLQTASAAATQRLYPVEGKLGYEERLNAYLERDQERNVRVRRRLDAIDVEMKSMGLEASERQRKATEDREAGILDHILRHEHMEHEKRLRTDAVLSVKSERTNALLATRQQNNATRHEGACVRRAQRDEDKATKRKLIALSHMGVSVAG